VWPLSVAPAHNLPPRAARRAPFSAARADARLLGPFRFFASCFSHASGLELGQARGPDQRAVLETVHEVAEVVLTDDLLVR